MFNVRADSKLLVVYTRLLLVGLVPRVCEELFREMEVRKKGNKGVTYEVCYLFSSVHDRSIHICFFYLYFV